MLNHRKVSILLVSSIVAHWIYSSYLHEKDRNHQLIDGLAYNTLQHAFKNIESRQDIYHTIDNWDLEKKSANIGALVTICRYNPEILVYTTKFIDNPTAARICVIHLNINDKQ